MVRWKAHSSRSAAVRPAFDRPEHGGHDEILKCPLAGFPGRRQVAAPDDDFRHSVDAILGCVTDRTRVVIIANPDNPSGTYRSGAEVRRLRENLPPNVLLIIDGAYEEYAAANDHESGARLVAERDDVAVTRTISKVFAMAGLRLGWCCAPVDTVDLLNRIGPSFPVNSPSATSRTSCVSPWAGTRRWRPPSRRSTAS